MRPGRFSQSRLGLRDYRGIFGVGQSGPPVPSAGITGLTSNPTYGATAQIGTTLTCVVANGTPVSFEWRTAGGAVSGGGAASYLVDAGIDTQGLFCRVDLGVDGIIDSPIYTVRREPPVATGLAPINATQGGGAIVTDLRAGFAGDDLTFTETPDVPWASISGNDLTVNDEVRTDTVTVQAENSGGPATAVQSVTITAQPAPDPFVDADWSVATGSGGSELDVTIASLPADNGATITVVEYDVDGGGVWTSLPSYAGTGSYTITMAAEDTSYDIRLRAVNSGGEALPGNSETATSGVAAGSPVNGVYGITMTGQSLAVGTSGENGANGYGASLYNGIMLDNSITTGFAAEGGTPRGNTFPTATTATKQFDSGDVALVDALAEIVAAEGGEATGSQSFESLIHNVAVGNSQAAGLIGTQLSYKTYFLPDLTAQQAALTNTSKTLDGKWVGMRRQGERDQVVGTDSDEFKGVVIAEQAMRTSDLSFEFGQDIDYDMVTYQLSSHGNDLVAGAGGPYIPRIALDLLELCRDQTLSIYLSNPDYYLPHADDVHLNDVGYNQLGAAEARVAKRLHWDDARLEQEPFAIRAAWISGNDIILRYGIESGRSLALDTTLVSAHTNMGFELYQSDGTTAITITGVSVTGTNEVTLSTGSARSAGEIVRYAYTPPTTGASGVSGPTGGPRGNLRDDTPLTFEYDSTTYNLYRWAAHDQFTVSGSSGEPAAWTANPHAVKTLSQIATDHSLTGLFDIHTDDATSIVNHAGTDGTVTGTPTYSSGGASFGVGDYIDTGIADTMAFTLMAIITPADIPSSVNKNILFNYLSGGVSGGQRTGLYYNRFTDRIATWMRDSGGSLNINEAEPAFTELNNLRPYMVIATYDPAVDTNYTINLPRYWNPQSDAISAGRTVDGTNFIIGNGSDPILIHAIAIAPQKMTFEEQGRLYRDMVYNLRDRGLYI